MVLRRKAVGEQGAADQQGAFSRGGGPVPAPAGAGPPLLARMPAAPRAPGKGTQARLRLAGGPPMPLPLFERIVSSVAGVHLA